MNHSLTEKGRWAAAESGNLGEIYREHVEYVWRVVAHLGVSPADVSDVAQDVFITVGRRISTFEGRSTLRTWIYGICIRTVSDYRGRAHRRREVPHEQVPDSPQEPDQQAVAHQGQLRARLAEVLATLKPEQLEVFVLYEIEELSMRDVAEAIDCPLQTAYSRLHAARAQLKSKLKNGGHQP